MTTTTLRPSAASPGAGAGDPATSLRLGTLASRVGFTWLGVRKTLTIDQRALAAEAFGAHREALSAGKKLLDTRHPAFRAVTAVRGRIVACWKSSSLPYPEPGVRLIRREHVEAFDDRLRQLQTELGETVDRLDAAYPELIEKARERLGALFNPGDYPSRLEGFFGLWWDFPGVEPPRYLLELHPEIYARQQQQLQARFQQAVELAEQAFSEEFARLLGHLTERLRGEDDGRPKVFRDSAIGNLQAFFERFGELNLTGSDQLDDLIDQARRLLRGVEPGPLRQSAPLRQRLADELAGVQAHIEGLLVDRPRRRILRPDR